MRFSFTKRDSWVTNGTLALHFTLVAKYNGHNISTTVEIILYYLTYVIKFDYISSTAVEIILYYLTI